MFFSLSRYYILSVRCGKYICFELVLETRMIIMTDLCTLAYTISRIANVCGVQIRISWVGTRRAVDRSKRSDLEKVNFDIFLRKYVSPCGEEKSETDETKARDKRWKNRPATRGSETNRSNVTYGEIREKKESWREWRPQRGRNLRVKSGRRFWQTIK